MNIVIFRGRVGSDPEPKKTSTGHLVIELSLVEVRPRKKDAPAEWHRFVFWNKNAEVAEKYVRKGTILVCSGAMRVNSWETKDGKKAHRTVVWVDSFEIEWGPSERDTDLARARAYDSERSGHAQHVSDALPALASGDYDIPF